nr:uncharacterized protein LOC109155647 [Ipomoea trifida]
MGSDRTHPVEPPPQDPVNVIHEVPVYPQATGPVTYQYPLHPMGVPDLNYPWWQGTPQYYPTPYQFQPGIYPQPAYVPVPETPPNPINPELRRAQSKRRASGPYHDPSGPSRAPLPTQTEAVEAAEYESPRRRSAFDRLRRSARERLGVREEGRRSVDGPGRDLLDLLVRRLLLPAPSRGSGDLKVHCGCSSGRTYRYGRCRPCAVGTSTGRGALLPPKVTFGRGFFGPVEAGAKLRSRTIPAKNKLTVIRRLQVGSRNAFGRPEDPVLVGLRRDLDDCIL